ncbi:MAG: type II toxin-antitoxin system RelE/ParE family toxin [Candidatus Rokubacteria bacterium]|nr:type II toxin-antitoxin system RelE/ParE family toxin [Candidatus Rokubacteria bacterium]
MARYEVNYFDEVLEDDIPGIPANVQDRIERAIEERLKTAPEKYGERLRKSLIGLWKIRVGDYRIIYTIDDKTRHHCHREAVHGEGVCGVWALASTAARRSWPAGYR